MIKSQIGNIKEYQNMCYCKNPTINFPRCILKHETLKKQKRKGNGWKGTAETEQNRNGKETEIAWKRNGNGMETELNGNGMEAEQRQNGKKPN